MLRVDLHCVHGTFQAPSAWSDLEVRLAPAGIRVVPEEIVPPSDGGFTAWAAKLCAAVRGPGAAPGASSPRVLLGYSLGGRLAMHALLACPGAWAAAVLVAAHPGEADPGARRRRRVRDAEWARRCRSEPLSAVLAAWDGQAVFGGAPNPAPRPADLDPERQARLFEAFSRGRQDDLRQRLAAAPLPPVLYVTGSRDEAYSALGRELAARVSGFRHLVVEGAGHRVPWERPDAFAAAVAAFLAERPWAGTMHDSAPRGMGQKTDNRDRRTN